MKFPAQAGTYAGLTTRTSSRRFAGAVLMTRPATFIHSEVPR